MSGPEELRALVEDFRALLRASENYYDIASGHFSDTTYDSDGCLAEADAVMFVTALPNARTALTLAESSLASPAGMEGWMPTHRHKKRGTQYEVIGIGKMQAEHWIDQRWTRQPESGEPPKPSWSRVDLREVVVYRSLDDGSLWVRPREEFEDGRFEALRSLEGRDE